MTTFCDLAPDTRIRFRPMNKRRIISGRIVEVRANPTIYRVVADGRRFFVAPDQVREVKA